MVLNNGSLFFHLAGCYTRWEMCSGLGFIFATIWMTSNTILLTDGVNLAELQPKIDQTTCGERESPHAHASNAQCVCFPEQTAGAALSSVLLGQQLHLRAYLCQARLHPQSQNLRPWGSKIPHTTTNRRRETRDKQKRSSMEAKEDEAGKQGSDERGSYKTCKIQHLEGGNSRSVWAVMYYSADATRAGKWLIGGSWTLTIG